MAKKDKQYFNIVNYILESDIFNGIEAFSHHGTNRLKHSMRVSYYSYIVAKSLRLDYKAAAVSGLLHDFYLCDDDKGFIKYLKFQNKHPKIAAANAITYFKVSKKEKNIIETHMWPFNKPSRYLEGWIVSLVDKGTAIYEYSAKFNHQLALWLLSLIRIIK